jgi:CRISPR-associated protein Cmr4
MYEAATMLYIYVETPLHAGTGRGLGAVDLPIQRDVVTGYPLVQASSLKGRLRAEAAERKMPSELLKAIFGPEAGDGAPEHAGALAPGDARLLLFPLRSLAGVFAWATSRDLLARFTRDAEMAGLHVEWKLPENPPAGEALVSGDQLVAGDRVVLEEYAFGPRRSEEVARIGRWLAERALPPGEEYDYWRESLPERLVLLPQDALRDFTLLSTEVDTRVRLRPGSKTVQDRALWTEEALPTDTLLYAPLMASPSRNPGGPRLSGTELLEKLRGLGMSRMQMGGDETTGRGMVFLRFDSEGGAR